MHKWSGCQNISAKFENSHCPVKNMSLSPFERSWNFNSLWPNIIVWNLSPCAWIYESHDQTKGNYPRQSCSNRQLSNRLEPIQSPWGNCTGSTTAVWEVWIPVSSLKSLGVSRKNKLRRLFLCPKLLLFLSGQEAWSICTSVVFLSLNNCVDNII